MKEKPPATSLFYSFYDVVAELGFDGTRNLTLLELESGFLKLLNHFASGEGAEVSAFL